MATNKEWLKSLSDEQLADEIKYGGGSVTHRESSLRELDEALLEKQRREQDRRS